MWKESYKTGVERIDFQHQQLFEKTGELLKAIETGASPFVYQEILSFLKGYVLSHFRHEEAYQEKIANPDIEAHKQAHRAFAALIQDYEEKLTGDDFSLALVKDLAGTLTAWLTYHVCHIDRRMVLGERDDVDDALSGIQLITASVEETLRSLTGLSPEKIRSYDAAAGNITEGVQIDIDIFGDINGSVTYTYTDNIALGLFEQMTGQRPAAVDEMVLSALSEITNIATGSATIKMTHKGLSCDIKPPRIRPGHGSESGFDGIVIDTALGKLKVSAQLNDN